MSPQEVLQHQQEFCFLPFCLRKPVSWQEVYTDFHLWFSGAHVFWRRMTTESYSAPGGCVHKCGRQDQARPELSHGQGGQGWRHPFRRKITLFSIWLPSCQKAGRPAFSGPGWWKWATCRVSNVIAEGMNFRAGEERQRAMGLGLQKGGSSPACCLPLADHYVLDLASGLNSVPP